MNKFDFKRHRVVAVPYQEDDPEKGQHFHVDLKDLVEEIKSYVQERAIKEGGEQENPIAVSPQSMEIPEEINEKLVFIERKLRTLEGRLVDHATKIDELESRPHISSDELRQLTDGMRTRFRAEIENQVAGAFGDVKNQIAVIKSQEMSVAPQSGQITALAGVVRELGSVVREIEENFEAKNKDMELKYEAIAQHIERTQGNMKRIAGVVHDMGAAINKHRSEVA